ncbi:MAG: energy-coupling factor transporter ATPase [Thermaerobacterales bacterium]
MSITLQNLSHTYQPGSPWAVAALFDINLEIDTGEAVAVIGATGSGKSTLVQHLNGLLKPTAGTVRVGGEDIWARGFSRRKVRQQVGLIFQYPEQQLFEETVRADIAYGPRNLGLTKDEIEARVQWAVKQVGLPVSVLDRSPFELSGGQMRRAAIAGILAMQPHTLILDEPTAGLDPQGRRDILGRVAEFHREHGMTVIIVSHNMEEVARLVDRVVVMAEGRIAFDGPTRDVFGEGPRLRSLGLDLPEMARLMEALRERGWDVPLSVLDVDEAERVIGRMTAAAGGKDSV